MATRKATTWTAICDIPDCAETITSANWQLVKEFLEQHREQGHHPIFNSNPMEYETDG